MSDHDRASQGRLARLCGMGKPWLILSRLPGCGAAVRAGPLDDRIKRDIGIDGTCLDPAARADRRGDHYSRLLRRGYPLG